MLMFMYKKFEIYEDLCAFACDILSHDSSSRDGRTPHMRTSWSVHLGGGINRASVTLLSL